MRERSSLEHGSAEQQLSGGWAPGAARGDHFSGIAARYARARPGYPGDLFWWLASCVPHRDLAWDCATGNGQAAVALAAHFARVVATDASAEQISQAADAANVEYRIEPAEQTSLAVASVDLVTVATAVHWLDLERFYAEVRRVVRPGGLLAVWTYHLPEIAPRVDAVLRRYYGEVLAGYWPDGIELLDTRYRTLPFPFEEVEPPPFDSVADWDLGALEAFLGTWSASRRRFERERKDPLLEVRDDLSRAWGPPTGLRRVRWPLHLRVGRV